MHNTINTIIESKEMITTQLYIYDHIDHMSLQTKALKYEIKLKVGQHNQKKSCIPINLGTFEATWDFLATNIKKQGK